MADEALPDADVPGMTTEALRAEFLTLAPEYVRIHNRRQLLAAEIERREKAAGANALVQSLTPEQREALKQALGGAA